VCVCVCAFCVMRSAGPLTRKWIETDVLVHKTWVCSMHKPGADAYIIGILLSRCLCKISLCMRRH
jgi:hypothetical protein